ncbi:MAG: signal peptidase II, partial [Duncaniella sp.]|nr:signal peptidase II [Duncaniella sp.]
FVTAGAAGNIFDCVFYGLMFNNPLPPQVASLFPAGGGYAPVFLGRVVDMLYFPLFSFVWPSWMPFVGGEHFLFFQPIFNIADAAISCGIIVLVLFYHRYILPPKALAELPAR